MKQLQHYVTFYALINPLSFLLPTLYVVIQNKLMATPHQQESLTALYRSIKYCEELGLPCNDIYSALGHLENELRKDRENHKEELGKIESVLY